MSANLKNMAAIDFKQPKGIDFLGYLCWYTIYDNKITRSELENKFIDAGIDIRYMPNKIKAVDAFRRATAELEENRLPYSGTEKYQNFLVREVLCDRKKVVRHLIREVVDGKNVRLEYTKAAEITFNREYETIHVHSTDNGTFDRVSKVDKLFKEYKETYDGQHLRRMVRTILYDMNPAAVRPSGGVYFVPQRYQDQLFALERLIRSIGGEFFAMPLIDQENSRDMLYQKFSEQVEENIAQMKDILQKQNVQKSEMIRVIENAKKLFAQIDEYEELLNKNLNDLKVGVDVLKEQILTLLEVA